MKQSHCLSENHFQNLQISHDIKDIKMKSTKSEYPFGTVTGFELTTT